MINGIKNVGSLSLTDGLKGLASLAEGAAFTAVAVTPGAQTGLSFAAMLGNMSVNAMNDIKRAEVASFAGIKGEASTREVVDAVLSGEQSLQTAIALRDKIVSAYLEITKMQI